MPTWEIRQYIEGSESLRFHCAPEIARSWPALADFAAQVGVTRISEISFGALTIFAKMEWENPGQTVKDRAVLGMLHALLLRDKKPGEFWNIRVEVLVCPWPPFVMN